MKLGKDARLRSPSSHSLAEVCLRTNDRRGSGLLPLSLAVEGYRRKQRSMLRHVRQRIDYEKGRTRYFPHANARMECVSGRRAPKPSAAFTAWLPLPSQGVNSDTVTQSTIS